MWTYERTIFGGQPSRAFVWMQGHTYTNFKKPEIEGMLLRGIAWAAHYPAETLVSYVARARADAGAAGAAVSSDDPYAAGLRRLSTLRHKGHEDHKAHKAS